MDKEIIKEAVGLIATGLSEHKERLAEIYRFPLNNSLAKLTTLAPSFSTTQLGTRRYQCSVAVLSQWLQQSDYEAAMGPADGDKTTFEQALTLRKLIGEVLKFGENHNIPDLAKIARWVVTDWGGVDRRRKLDCARLIEDANGFTENANDAADEIWLLPGRDEYKYDRIASWSKYLAFRYPKSRAMMDSRVVYSLNWYLKGATKAPLFPSLPSENTLLRLLDHSAIIAGSRLGWERFENLVKADITKIESGSKSGIRGNVAGGCEISPNNAYCYYLSILKGLSVELFGDCEWRITKTEMLLFGVATTKVAKEVVAAVRAGRI